MKNQIAIHSPKMSVAPEDVPGGSRPGSLLFEAIKGLQTLPARVEWLVDEVRRARGRWVPALSRSCGRAVVGLLFWTATPNTRAQNYSIDWFSIDGGGGTSASAGGAFTVNGTIGQVDATIQPLAGGNFSLAGGYWSVAVVTLAGAPPLNIRMTTTNTVLISWPASALGFALQESSDLKTTNWVSTSQPVTDNGTSHFILVNPPTGNRFYRLFKP